MKDRRISLVVAGLMSVMLSGVAVAHEEPAPLTTLEGTVSAGGMGTRSATEYLEFESDAGTWVREEKRGISSRGNNTLLSDERL